MVVGTEQYTWPSNPPIMEPFYIEGLDTNSNNEPYAILQAPDMAAWSAYDQNANDVPVYYRLIDVAGTVMLALRPNPIRTDGIRITSLIPAVKFPTTKTSTVDQDSAAAAKVLYVASTTPFAIGSHVIVGEGTAREEKGVVLTITAGASLNMTANLAYTHTAAQADVVELTTPFMHENSDQALAMLIAAHFKLKRGDPGRASELAGMASKLLPPNDPAPTLRGTNRVRPWHYGGGRISRHGL